MTALHVRVHGRVQGVGFRWFVRERAREAGLRGWVRNLPDGSVEVAAEGEEGLLARLRASLEAGPPGARVAGLEELGHPANPPVGDSFSILR